MGWLGIVVASTLGSPLACAGGSGDQKAAAQVLFDRGQALVEQNRFAEACPQLAESERLDPALGTLLWLADCYENNGQTANAWAAFKQATAMAAARHDPREPVARDRAARLESRLSRLAIVVSPGLAETPGFEVHVDGVPVDSEQWAQGVSLDPGTHTLTANATNRQVWWTTVQLAPGSAGTSTTVTIPELPILPPDAAPWAAGVPGGLDTPLAVSPRRAADPGRARLRAVGVGLGLGGAVSVIVGSVFSLNAKARYDDSRAFCLPDNECGAIGAQDRREADSMATVATVLMGGGAAVLAGGAVAYFLSTRPAPPALAFTPVPRGASVRAAWAW